MLSQEQGQGLVLGQEEEGEKGIFLEEEDCEQNEHGEYPVSYYFDSHDAVATAHYGKRGRKLRLYICKPAHLDVVVLKSDVAVLSITECELEEGAGTGRLSDIRTLLKEMQDRLQTSASLFSHNTPHGAKFQVLLEKMSQYLEVKVPFTLVLDDPLSNSFIRRGTEEDLQFQVSYYERTWQQNHDLALLTPIPEEQNCLPPEEAVHKIAELLRNSNKVAAFTGAGISVESGIPAFRQTKQQNDFWSQYAPESRTLQNFFASEENRIQYWTMKTEFYELVQQAKPNPAHQLFKLLAEQNKLLGVVTQNIDLLHEAAEVPEDMIIHLHGSEGEARCLSCSHVHDRAELHESLWSELKNGNLKSSPQCSKCKGILKSGTILFGEPLKPEALDRSTRLMEDCDLLFVIGSSLVVQPANQLPAICLSKQTPVVIINQSATQYDDYATLVVNEPCGQFLSDVAGHLGSAARQESC